MTTPQPTRDDILTALRDARNLIARGWCRGTASDGDNFCAVGALAESSHTITRDGHTIAGYLIWRQALAALNAKVPAPYPNLVAFNDSTDQKSVLSVFDNAIAYVTELPDDHYQQGGTNA